MSWFDKMMGNDNSKEPQETRKEYFDMRWSFMPDGRARLEYVFDDAFVKVLRKKGFVGSSDDQVIQQFVDIINSQKLEGDEDDQSVNFK